MRIDVDKKKVQHELEEKAEERKGGVEQGNDDDQIGEGEEER